MDMTLAYIVNAKTSETTRYSNFNFDHVLKFKGKYYGVAAGGVYLLEGADDIGTQIDARFRTAKNDFGTAHLKRVPYLFIDTDSDTMITPHVDDVQYPSYPSNYEGKRTKIGRGIKGRYWGFEFSNVSGASMRVNSAEFEPEVLSRKLG